MADIGLNLGTDQLVLTKGRDFRWSFRNLDAQRQPVDFPAGDLFFELQTRNESNAKQSVLVTAASGGTYRFGFKEVWSDPIDFDDITNNPQNLSGDITDALEAMSTIGAGNVIVTPSSLFPVWELDLTLNRGANEVQRITINGSPTGGYYTLTFGGKTTAHIAYNADAAAIQAALEALPNIGTGNVSVSGTAPTFDVTFQGSLALTNVPQIVPNYTHWVDIIFLLRTLTGGTKPSVSVTTTTPGSTPLTEQQVNTINTALNNFYNTFEDLIGVDIDITVLTNYNITVKVKSRKSFNEAGLKTFAVNVTSTLIANAFNAVTELVDKFDVIHVAFYWDHTYEVEFVNDLGISPQPKLETDITSLESINEGAANVIVTVEDPGKAPITKWPFTVAGDLASIKVESEEVNKIADRTEWQLVFLPDGEEAGGDPVAEGLTKIKMPKAWVPA